MNIKFISTGLCSPYAVVNGEDRMVEHIESGVIDVNEGDIVFVFTDGFEYYVKNTEFTNLFKNWPNDLKEQILKFSQKMNSADPEKYGRERSLIAISI